MTTQQADFLPGRAPAKVIAAEPVAPAYLARERIALVAPVLLMLAPVAMMAFLAQVNIAPTAAVGSAYLMSRKEPAPTAAVGSAYLMSRKEPAPTVAVGSADLTSQKEPAPTAAAARMVAGSACLTGLKDLVPIAPGVLAR